MRFHLGKPVLVMLLIAVVTGTAVALRPRPRDSDLHVWVFADAHARTYRSIQPQFERTTGRSLDIDLVTNAALNMRLTSLILAGGQGERPPDAVEIEIGSIGRYFGLSTDRVGFLPLNDRLANSGWMDRIVRSRFAPWTKEGVIFGVPHDVHPVTITYRHDLFSEAGVDLEAAETWPKFQSLCLQFQRYWRSRGYVDRHAMELPLAAADNIVVMLVQRRVNLVDDYDRLHLRNPRVAHTVAFYARMVAGPDRIGAESAGGRGVWTTDLVAGNVCAVVTPDWKLNDLKTYAPALAGKMRMMPLPRFDPADARTSTWGGTMIGIPRHAKDPDASWKLIEFLYLSDAGVDARVAQSTILPPLPEHFHRPEYQQPDPYFGGQKVDALYAELAAEIPPRYMSPLTIGAQMAISVTLSRATDYLRDHGREGLEAKCAEWLALAEQDLLKRLAHAEAGG